MSGGNSTVGTILPTSDDIIGNPRATYTAPSSVPSSPACLETSDGCAVAVKAELVRHEAACFSTITIHSVACTLGVVERISIDSDGGNANGESREPFIDATGRFIGFHSSASDLVSGDTNGVADVFVRDTCRGAVSCTPSTTRISVSTGGAEADGPSNGDGDAFSGDARFIAFESLATNLVAGDTNGVSDIFLRDTCFGATSCTPSTIRVSVGSSGAEGSGPSRSPSISATGRFVVFESDSTFDTADTNFSTDIYLRDTCIGATSCTPSTTLISVNTGGTAAGNGPSNLASDGYTISSDGRFVTFQSLADDLVGGDTNFTSDVFRRDTCIGATSCTPGTIRISVDNSGNEGNDFSEEATIDGSGRFIAYGSFSTNLVGSDTNATSDVFLRDTCFGATSCTPSTTLISKSTTGGVGNGTSFSAVLSRNGRFIAWDSEATNLVTGFSDTNGDFDVFVRDTCFGATACAPETRIVSVNSAGAVGNAISHVPSITDDGRFVALESGATNHVGDDTNSLVDIFLAQTCFVP